MPRILRCNDCHTLDKLPDFTGPPEDDLLLENLIVTKHVGLPGDSTARHRGMLFVCDQATWDKIDETGSADAAIQKELEDIQGEAFASRDTYREDALKCYSQHGRPKNGCIDWRDTSKRIEPPTEEGKRFARENPKLANREWPFLCSFCPVASWVMVQQRIKRGAYR